MSASFDMGRRPILQGLFFAGAASLAGAAESAPPASGQTPFDLTNPKDLSLIFRKLGYAADERLGFWHLNAIRYGLVGTRLIPFWEMHIGRFFTTHDRPDGSYAVTQMGLTFYSDPNTGERLRRFNNPLTGKTVEIPYGQPKARAYAPPEPIPAHYESINMRGDQPAGSRPGLEGTGALGPAWVQGDTIWVEQDHLLEYPAPHKTGVQAHVNDLTTYFGPLSEVADPANKMPRAGHAFTDINDWPEWLEMGDQPGAYYSRGLGFKATSFEAMPPAWKAFALEDYPKIARDPGAALQGG